MRVVVLALSLALVGDISCGCTIQTAPEFAAGKTYTYKYEALLFSGLPEQSTARAGLKVSSKVLISATSQNMLMLKLVEPEILEYSGVWPKDPMTKATKLTSALTSQLMTPIKFEYDHGVVGKMYAPEGVSVTVMNIYRGILNVLQLNIKKTQNVYELQEAGAQGVCKTLYAITEDEKAERILLTKTRDLDHCQERIVKDLGLAYTQTCAKCQQVSKSLRGATAYNYILKEVSSGVMILEATVNELIQYTPFTEVNGAAQMETKQSLVFIEITKGPIIPINAAYIHRGSLKYEFSNELLQTPIQMVRVRNIQSQILQILDHLVVHNKERVHEDSPLKYMELVQYLRSAHFEDLEMIWNQFKHKPEYRKWIIDAVPSIGNEVALKFIKEKILANELTFAETAQALIASIHLVTANSAAIREIESLLVNNKIIENQMLREIVYLGYGTMISKHCIDKAVCPSELIKPIQEQLADAVAKDETRDIVLFLKVLGNAGLPTSIKPITKILPIHGTAATSLPMRVHSDAIMALRNIARKEPRMIQDLSLQLYMDKALHPELRMLACIVLFETRPPMGLVTTLANIVKNEENLQVASFTYSHMKSLTRSTAIPHASVAAACNVAIKILSSKLDRMSMRFSKAVHMDIFDTNYMVGAAASAFYINDAATILPRSVVAKATAYIAGAAADVLEFGVRTEGIQEAFLKNSAITENVDRITKMKRVIKAISDWRSLPVYPPLGSVYIKLFGQEVAFANIDKSWVDHAIAIATGPSVENMARDIVKSLLSGISLNFIKPVLATEMRRILPTAAGLPMELSLYTAAVAGANVEFKAKATPSPPDNFRLSHLLKTNIELQTEMKPSIAMNSFAVMGVNTEIIQAVVLSRASVNSFIPAKIEATLDIAEGHFKIVGLPMGSHEHLGYAQCIETNAIVRNIEEPSGEKSTPVIPVKVVKTAEMMSSRMVSNAASVSKSSEMVEPEIDSVVEPIIKNKREIFQKKYCAKVAFVGVKTCFKFQVGYQKSGNTYVAHGQIFNGISVPLVEGKAVERLEMEVQVGAKAAEKLIKRINLSGEEEEEEATPPVKPVLAKLKKILTPGLKNSTMSSSSSSSSQFSSSLGSKSSASSSSSRLSSKPVKPLSKRRSMSVSSSSRRVDNRQKFVRHHKKQMIRPKATSAEVSRSRSSASSFEAIYSKKKFLGKEVEPSLAIIFRAVRADQKVEGFEISAYLDKPAARLQIILAALAEENNWKFCADGIILSKHKVTAKFAWGAECKQYDTIITAETGLLGPNPAARLRLAWTEIPSVVRRYANMVIKYIPEYIWADWIHGKELNSEKQLSLTLVATSDKTLELIGKTPTRTLYRLNLHLPIALPLDDMTGLVPFDDLSEKIGFIVSKAGAAECRYEKEMLTTFNKRQFKNEMPLSCYQVVAQDSTEEMKFMVLLKKDHVEQHHFNVKVADIDIDLYPRNSDVIVKVNGMEIPISNLPYQHPTARIQIRPRGEGISVIAPSLGLHEVYFGRDSWRVEVSDWMKGKTSGLCGRADGEIKQEFHTPYGRVTKSPISFAHSWVLPAETCRDMSGKPPVSPVNLKMFLHRFSPSECRMKLESVMLEKQMVHHGQDSKCFSVEPVLRCLPGCFPVKTIPVTVGFHCQATVMPPARIYESSVDLRETAEAHVACSCTAQCA
ncbi:vitellogenin-like [Synchiropus picturatus]